LLRHPDIGEGQSARRIIGADIAERKMLEKQLVQAQKLRSIGQLAFESEVGKGTTFTIRLPLEEQAGEP
jgi:hypothetical protein